MSSQRAAADAPTELLDSSLAGPAATRGGALRTGGYLVGVLVSVVSAALLFRHLGVIDTGRYVLALSLVAIIGALSDLGLTAVGVREISRLTESERWPLAQALLGLRISLTLLGGVVVTAITALVYSPMLAAGVALASVGLLLQAAQDNFSMPLVVDLRLGWVAAIELLRQVLSTVAILLLVFAGAGLLPFLAVSIPVGLVALAVTVQVVRGRRSLMPTFDLRRWRGLLSAILPYALAVAASVLYFRVAIILVSLLSTELQSGYFNASFRIVEVLTVVPALLASSALPIFARAARDDHERLGYAIGRVFEVSLIVGAWVAVSIAVGATLAVEVIGGKAYAPAAPVLAFQGVALGAMFVSVVWSNALLSLGLYRLILVINVGALALNSILVALLVSGGGARGAAIATAISEVVAAVVQALAVVHRRHQLRPSLRVMPRVGLAAALGLTPLAMTGVPVVAQIAISTTLFVAALWITRAFPPELRALIPPFLSRTKSVGM